MLRTGTGILSNVEIIILKRENQFSFSHWTDEKSGNPEKVGRMASLFLSLNDNHFNFPCPKGVVTNDREGCYKTGGGGHVKFYPYKYERRGGGAEKVLAMLKGGGGTKNVGVVLTQELEVLAIL